LPRLDRAFNRIASHGIDQELAVIGIPALQNSGRRAVQAEG
jgi:hypothetical protein